MESLIQGKNEMMEIQMSKLIKNSFIIKMTKRVIIAEMDEATPEKQNKTIFANKKMV